MFCTSHTCPLLTTMSGWCLEIEYIHHQIEIVVLYVIEKNDKQMYRSLNKEIWKCLPIFPFLLIFLLFSFSFCLYVLSLEYPFSLPPPRAHSVSQLFQNQGTRRYFYQIRVPLPFRSRTGRGGKMRAPEEEGGKRVRPGNILEVLQKTKNPSWKLKSA